MADDSSSFVVPARTIRPPSFLSPVAQACLAQHPATPFPPIEDKQAWRDHIEQMNKNIALPLQQMAGQMSAEIVERNVDGVRCFEATPTGLSPQDRAIILDFHRGALILLGGETGRFMVGMMATQFQKRVCWVDYRMPPDHPYPAGLDDGLTVYRALLRERSPTDIIVSGGSAGGNLAAALLLRAREASLPMPAGLLLNTPEVDLTESGDSFQTNMGVDPLLKSLMPVNLLYANGHNLSDPFLSPLFGDLAGFPPTILTTGTRDLFLSNTVRMHRALRSAGKSVNSRKSFSHDSHLC